MTDLTPEREQAIRQWINSAGRGESRKIPRELLAALDAERARAEQLIGLLWDVTKAPSSPLWWCLDETIKDEFRSSFPVLEEPQ